MFEQFFHGLFLVLQWPSIGFLCLGVFIGLWLGVLPGLGGIVGLVLLLPFTFSMDPVSAFALLLGMFAVTSTSDTITAVMVGVPGPSSQAIMLDGYPLAKQGHAERALGASFAVSAFGGVFGAAALALSLPIMQPLVLSFTSPEVFMLGVLGLSLVGMLSGRSIPKGIAVATFGLVIACVGYAPTISIPRFHFGTDYLIAGLPLIPIILGLFGLPELMELAIRNVSISQVPRDQTKGGRLFDGVKDAVKHWWLVTRCAALGTYIGVLPGVGGSIVDWVAYGHAVQSAKDKSKFGQGDIRGVLAPDVANNACKGGDLIPTVGFGIPGSLGAAILLGALVIQGLKPGPEMLGSSVHITFSMVWSIALANIMASIILFMTARQFARLAFVPGHLIVPGVILFVFMGAWLGSAALGDWITVFVFGVVGFLMKRGGWPRPPLVLAMVLGSIMENTLVLSMRVHDGLGWLGRPIVLIILALIAITVLLSVTDILKSKRTGNVPKAGEGTEKNPLVSLPLAFVLLALFAYAIVDAQQWPRAVSLFPLVSAIIGGAMVLLVLLREIPEARGAMVTAGGAGAAIRSAWEKAELTGASAYFGYMLAIILLSMVVGQKIAIPIFVAVYLVRWGEYDWKVALAYAVAAWAILVFFYDWVMSLLWYPPLIESFVRSVLPARFPFWLFF